MLPSRFGPRLGAVLHAAALETEFEHSSIPKLNSPGKIALKLLLALLLLTIYRWLKPWWALGATLLLMILTMFLSFLAIYSNWQQIDGVPLLLGLWIDQLVESTQEAQEALEEHPPAMQLFWL